jgi:hypothetical protein
MTLRRKLPLLGLAVLALAHRAQAGLLDSPPPSFDDGATGRVVYRMGPVHYDPGHVDTVVKCTSIDDASLEVALEVFDESDSRAGAVARTTLAPGGSVSFVTAADAASGVRVVVQGLPALDHGKVRVSATSARLSCSGHNRIVGGDGSASERAFELIKKVAR